MNFYTHVATSGTDVLVRGYENGERFERKVAYEPYLFESDNKPSGYTTLEGRHVRKVQFDDMRAARDWFQTNKDTHGKSIYGLNKFTYLYIYDNFPGAISYDPAVVSVVSLDIEVDIAGDTGFPDIQQADNAITLITISRHGKKAVFGCQPFDNDDPSVRYYQCRDEAHLLKTFLAVWNSDAYSPDIVTGWNVEFFDIPYIANRMIRVLGPRSFKNLSPWKKAFPRIITRAGREEQTYDILGISILDYMALYRKFAFTIQESYSLDYIAEQELGERKLDYGEYGSLAGLQTGNWQKYVQYNIRDVELVDKLDDKLKLIELCMAMAYDAKVNYQDTFTTVGLWDTIIHNYLMDRNIVVPPVKVGVHGESILGGYVKDPQVGQHNWVISLDLNSLYPHIIMQYNISPETFRGVFPDAPLLGYSGASTAEPLVLHMMNGFVDKENHQYLIDNDVTITANMRTFTRSKQGFLPAIMQRIYEDRVVYKKEMIACKQEYEKTKDPSLLKEIARLDNLQMAKKIQLNSGYGALANVYNRWYRAEFAEAITASGQLATRWIERELNRFLNKGFSTDGEDYVIACDTDSVYIRAERFVEAQCQGMSTAEIIAHLDKVCSKVIEPFIDKKYQELCTYVNGTDQKMKMKRECIADKGIWTAKKRYILNVWNQEGVAYDKPKLKMMGIEAIRTSTPQVCRKAIKDALGVIMNDKESKLHEFVISFRNEFMTLPFEQVAFPRSVSDIHEYADNANIFKKGTPINVKGALMYNDFLRRLKLDKKYEPIQSGQKIKFAYLKAPNPLHCNVIAAPSTMPVEFNLDKYIDRDLQFEKTFLDPISTIVNVIGWSFEKKSTLESFFE